MGIRLSKGPRTNWLSSVRDTYRFGEVDMPAVLTMQREQQHAMKVIKV